MFKQMLEIMKELEAEDEIFDTLARCHKKAYDAHIKAGFTEDQATRIVAHQGIGIQPN